MLSLSMVVTLLGGLALTAWCVRAADQRIRKDLILQARLVAQALSAEQVAALSGTENDLASPVYQRIKQQLQLARIQFPECRFIYLLRQLDDGRVVFLVDSEPADSPDCSPPGQEYKEITPLFRASLEKAQCSAEGPVQDRWGLWISGLATLFEATGTQAPVAGLGMDIDATRWREQLIQHAIPPLGFTLAFLICIGAARFLFMHRRSPSRAGWTRRLTPEVTLSLAAGLLMTALAGYLAWDHDRYARDMEFRRKAARQAELLQQLLDRVGSLHLESLANYFLNSESVTRAEFKEFTSFLLGRVYAQVWLWIPQGTWSGDEPRYPVDFVTPEETFADLRGVDLAADPALRQSLGEAARTGLTTASEPVQLGRNPSRSPVLLLARPVPAGVPGHTPGFVAVALDPTQLMQQALGRPSTRDEFDEVWFHLYHLRSDGSSTHLTCNLPGTHEPPPLDLTEAQRGSGRLVIPIMAYGQIYALAAQPGPNTKNTQLINPTASTILIGLLLTLLLTELVYTMTHRRTVLEAQVSERTAALRASEASYHGLFNSIRQAIFIQDRKGHFMDVNHGALAMFGYTRDEVLGHTMEHLLVPGPERLVLLRAEEEKVWQGSGYSRYLEILARRQSGADFPAEMWLTKGSYFGQDVLIAVVTDASERRRSEQERNKLQDQLQQAQRMESIGRLAGGVAHDFNNMLQAILGNASLALENNPSESMKEYLEEIRESAQRSADLTRQLLAFASRQAIRPKVINLNETINGMLKMLRRLIGENIHLAWIPGEQAWPVKVDPSQIDQIMANLVVNARDAIHGTGSIIIETANLPGGNPANQSRYPGCGTGDYVVLTVRDTGKGMDEETQAHIFEPFYTTKPSGQGVGLGLATVFGIVKQNMGFIHVESAPGEGSAFHIGIPRSHDSLVAAADAGAKARPRGGQETILLVEDEPAILRFTRDGLARLGYQVLAAQSPSAALEVARRHGGPIHMLCTDVVLPEMNGRELAQLLTSLIPSLKCLFVSGYTAEIIAVRGVVDENLNFIQKPFTLNTLAAKIRSVLDDTPTPP